MAFYVYRVNGGEVLGISLTSYGALPAQLAEVSNPSLPDGASLSPKKIFSAGAVKNASAAEISNFAVAEAADEKALSISGAKGVLDDGVFQVAVVRGLAELVLDEINLLRTNAGLAVRTKTQLINALKSKIDGLA